MERDRGFEIADFLPYLLNQAAETTGRGFQTVYKERYGMLRTEWRVLFHLGRYGEMSAKIIGEMARVQKTKISRAVKALEERRWIVRTEQASDRRVEMLKLTGQGRRVYYELCKDALGYQLSVGEQFSQIELETLQRCLKRLAHLPEAQICFNQCESSR